MDAIRIAWARDSSEFDFMGSTYEFGLSRELGKAKKYLIQTERWFNIFLSKNGLKHMRQGRWKLESGFFFAWEPF